MRTLTAENNPNIVGVYNVDEGPNEIKIYMEICEGGDLAQLIAERKKNGNYFSIPQAREIFR
jgi:serine/threonine protein kinase